MVPGGPCRELEDGQMSDYKLLIDGKLVSGAMTLNVVNPATEAGFARSFSSGHNGKPRYAVRSPSSSVAPALSRPSLKEATL